MKQALLICAVAASLGIVLAAEETTGDLSQEIVAMERQAMEGWLKGDAEPMLSRMDDRITYIHEITGKRLEGIAAVREMCEPYRGMPLFDSYEIAAPRTRSSGNTVVLSYQLVTHNGTTIGRWNMTQVYERQSDGWRVIHTHCSQTTPAPAPATQP